MLRLLRNLIESGVMVLLFVPWLAVAVVAWLAGRVTGRPRPEAGLGPALVRWSVWMRRGLRPYREAWWPLPEYEAYGVFWFHFLVVEFFAALNLAGRRERSEEAFLVIKLAHIGDAMHIGPMLQALRAARPTARIDLLVGPWCADLAKRWALPGDVWVYTPHLHLFHRGHTRTLRSLPSEWSLLWRLRRVGYTACLSTSTLSMSELMLITAAGPVRWVGAGNPVTAFYRELACSTEPYHSRQYEADRVGGLLRHLGLEGVTGRPDFPVTAGERAWAEGQWAQGEGRGANGDGRRTKGDGKRVVLAPGAGWPGKMWPAERFGALAIWLVETLGARVVVTGAPDEKTLGTVIAERCPAVTNLVGATTFGQTAGLVATADVLVCNDSGPLHLAAAYGIPSVTLFGPTVASKWHPPGEQHRMIQKAGLCEGCVGWHPAARCRHDGACMKAIGVDEVETMIMQVMQKEGSRS